MKSAFAIEKTWAEMARTPAVVFDLDGTLIDSRQAILDCWADALQTTGLSGEVPLDERLIGPSARDVAQRLAGLGEVEGAASLYQSFVSAYDDWGWQRCLPFQGVERQLHRLSGAGIVLHVVTNKRALPTQRILNSLGWLPLFASVYCPDQFGEPLRSKTKLIGNLLAQWDINPMRAVYVGDTPQDRSAALAHGLRFLAAWWGDASHHFPEAFIKAA